jgi:hypothetical protein
VIRERVGRYMLVMVGIGEADRQLLLLKGEGGATNIWWSLPSLF